MAVDLSISGADDFLRLSKALKHAGRTELRKELNAGMKDAAEPLIADTGREALVRLPSRGGLAAAVAKTPQRVQVRTGAATAGVRIVVGKSRSGARGAEQGVVRHPVFGRRDRFVAQAVRPGWFSDPLQAGAPKVRPELLSAMERIADQVIRESK